MDKEATEAAFVAAGAAAQLAVGLAALLAKTLDRPDIARDFTRLLQDLEQRPDTHPAAAVVYRNAAAMLREYR